MANASIQRENPDQSRRAAVRVGCNIPATIQFNGVHLCDGIIKDMSTSGLRLFVPKTSWLPHEFEISTHVFDRPVKVRKTWSNGELVGVKFVFGPPHG